MKKTTKKRAIDKTAKDVYGWWNKSVVVVSKKKVRVWKILLVVAFFSGIIFMVSWMVKLNVQTSSKAAEESPAQSAQIQKIAGLNITIQQSGANWTAGETPLSNLTVEQMRARLGARGDENVISDGKSYSPSSTNSVSLPETLDWTNKEGKNFVSPVKNQYKDQNGNDTTCGSCWAFASTAVLESASMIQEYKNGIGTGYNGTQDLSEQIVLSCTGPDSQGNPNNCNGGSTAIATKFLQNTGTGMETCYRYTGMNGDCSLSASCANWRYKVSSYSSFAGNLTSLKTALYENGPILALMVVYDDFLNYTGGIYKYVSGPEIGNHYVVLVGYSGQDSDPNGYFIAKNSWGEGWGANESRPGYFRIAYNQINSVVRLGFFAQAYTAVSPLPKCSVNSFVTNPLTVNYGGNANLSWVTSNTAGCFLKGGKFDGNLNLTSPQNTGALLATTSYALNCNNGGWGKCSSSINVNVNPPVACSIGNFLATPTTIIKGNSANLSWTASNSVGCRLQGGKFTGSPDLISPQNTGVLSMNTSYTLRCRNIIGAECSKTTSVNVVPCAINFSASPAFVIAGRSATLNWTTANTVGACKLVGGRFVGLFNAYTGLSTFPLFSTTNYALTCKNSYGEECSNTITVNIIR